MAGGDKQRAREGHDQAAGGWRPHHAGVNLSAAHLVFGANPVFVLLALVARRYVAFVVLSADVMTGI